MSGPKASNFSLSVSTTLGLAMPSIQHILPEIVKLFLRSFLLHNLGFSFQKARFVSDHLDTAKRLAWLEQQWPTILRAAKRRQGLILFEDEASFAQWGSLSDTWARRGQQPEVPTSGKRKG
jgi:hypothetical protein